MNINSLTMSDPSFHGSLWQLCFHALVEWLLLEQCRCAKISGSPPKHKCAYLVDSVLARTWPSFIALCVCSGVADSIASLHQDQRVPSQA